MGLLNTLRFIIEHPLNGGRKLAAIGRFASWQVGTRLVRGPVVVDFVDGTKLLVSRGQTGATGVVYAGLSELPEMAFVLHMIRPGELFVDVGANVGVYTILAAGAAGADCIAFEPAAAAFEALRKNVLLNDLTSRVELRQSAVGSTNGEISFTPNLDTLNHVVPPGTGENAVNVPVTTLDDALADVPLMIKIDVEGFESEVLRGASRVLRNPRLQAVIVETNGSSSRYSAVDEALHSQMTELGFTACRYDSFARHLEPMSRHEAGGNTIYVRDVAGAAARVSSARRFSVAGRKPL